MTAPRVLFAGTPAFALASLEALVKRGIVPVAVLTQPDRPAGRGKKRLPGVVKRYAVEHGIVVLQPATLRDAVAADTLRDLRPDLLVVAAYGLILPQAVLDIPVHGCLNVHASVLPRWRGAAPVQAAILANDESTGVSLMSMTAGLDCGPVFVSETVAIGNEETAGELHDRLAELGGELLAGNLHAILDGKLTATEQDESAVTYAGKISTADAAMNWDQPAAEICRRVRAWNPVPGAWFMAGGERIKCWSAGIGQKNTDSNEALPGTVLSADAAGVVVACRDTVVCLQELQRPGRRRNSAREFAAQTDLVGRVLV